jgi:hypothetical protein
VLTKMRTAGAGRLFFVALRFARLNQLG